MHKGNHKVKVIIKKAEPNLKIFFSVLLLDLEIFGWNYIGFLWHLLMWLLNSKRTKLFIAISRKSIIGYCLMYGKTIDRIGIKEEFRGRGIGRQLVPSFAAKVKTPSYRKEAIKFYKRLGFKELEKDRRFITLFRER